MATGSICEPLIVDPQRLVRVEQIMQPAGAPVPERFAHFHDALELVWFDSVAGELVSEDGRFALRAGTAVLLPSMRHHDFILTDAPRSWILVHVDPALVGGMGSDPRGPALECCCVVSFDGKTRGRLADLFAWLLALDKAGDDDRSLTLPLLQLVMQMIRRATPVAPSAPGDHAGGIARLRPALDRLARDPAAPLSLAAAASACQLSPPYFSRRFKATLGMTFSDYVRMYRLRLAAHRLLTSDARIASIAYDLGFAGAAHFGAQFHKRYGLSPRKYRSVGQAKAQGDDSF